MAPASTITSIATPAATATPRLACAHCGATCPDDRIAIADSHFCCNGCRAVYEILHQSGLDRFYRLEETPGVRIGDATPDGSQYAALDEASVRARILDFDNGKQARATFHIPAIHCAACVWLLENLFRMNPAIGASRVNFPRKEVALSFDPARLPLSSLVALLASLGYEPLLRLDALDRRRESHAGRRIAIQIGIAGFAFGNIMLLSFPSYLGLGENDALRPIFGWISFALAIPVLLISAADYWKAAWTGLRRRMLTIEFPLAMGIAALFAQSAWDVATAAGEGYFDSFAGLVFLLLCGRWVQQRGYDAMSFERDYKSYFPLSTLRLDASGYRAVPVTALQAGDVIRVRNGEIVPADCEAVSGEILMDYSFVTGEAEAVRPAPGETVRAGGRQLGGAVELRVVRPTSQSYLTSLWNHTAFSKDRRADITSFTNRVGRWFTATVLMIATAAAAAWFAIDPARAPVIFTAVLIVACPCALALSAPFAFGAAMTMLGRAGLYLRNSAVVESLARVDTIVFDKTGTLSRAGGEAAIHGSDLTGDEWRSIQAVASQSTHPVSRAIATAPDELPPVAAFRETPGAGVAGSVGGRAVLLGADEWLARQGVAGIPAGTGAAVAIDGRFRGRIVVEPRYRANLSGLLHSLGRRFRLALLSGDRDRERSRMAECFGPGADLRFNQSPADKLAAISGLQGQGRNVLMVGDGLNDAGALRQSDVGMAVAEDAASFSPASDAMLDARAVARLPGFLSLTRGALRVVQASLVISVLYNVIGLAFAVRGALSPLLAAILMPASSLTVVAFAVVGTRVVARRSLA